MRARAVALAVFLAAALAPAAARAALPPVQHVFVIVLENKDYDESFGASSKAPFLAHELVKRGQVLTHYYGTSHASLGNYISMVSGLAPNPETQGDCLAGFKNVFPGVRAPDGQVIGTGCVYPRDVQTIGDQLDAAGLSWKGYMEDMGNTPGEPVTCRHPAIGEVDHTQSARPSDQYATRHNPFVYFHSIIDDQARCDARVVPLDRLAGDLRSAATTPSLVFVTPDLCSDGHDEPCIDGRPGGLRSIDSFLREWVPRITASPAYAAGGALVITWDESNYQPGSGDKAAACCDEPSGPNTPAPGITGAGGGRTGTLVISPFTKPGTRNDTPYNHYSLLRSIEMIFHLPFLGYASVPSLRAFGTDVFDTPAPTAPTRLPPAGSALPACVAASSGAVLSGVRIERVHRHALLRFRARRSATVNISGRLRRVRPCALYRVRLPGRHGTVRLRAGGRVLKLRY